MMCSPFKLRTVIFLGVWIYGLFCGTLGLGSSFSPKLHSRTFIASQPKSLSQPPNSLNPYVSEKLSAIEIFGTTASPLTTPATSIAKPPTLSAGTCSFSNKVGSVYSSIQSSIDNPKLEDKTDDDKGNNERGVDNEGAAIKAKASKSPATTIQIEELCSVNCELCKSVGLTSASGNSTKRRSFSLLSGINAIKAIARRASSSDDEEWKLSEPDLREVQKDSRGYSTSEMARLGDSILSIGQIALYGCSSVVVISRYAVYMSHLYEVPSFTTFANGEDLRQGVRFVNSQFQERILDFLGNNELKKPEFTGSKKYPDPSPKAIIISPKVKSKKTAFKYPELVDRIAEALNKTLKLSEEPRRQGYLVAGTLPENSNASEYGLVDGKMALVYAPDNNSSAQNCERNSTAALWFGAPEVYTAIFKTQWAEQTGGPESGKGNKKCQRTTSFESETPTTVIVTVDPTTTERPTPTPTGYDCDGSSQCEHYGAIKSSLRYWCDKAAEYLVEHNVYGYTSYPSVST